MDLPRRGHSPHRGSRRRARAARPRGARARAVRPRRRAFPTPAPRRAPAGDGPARAPALARAHVRPARERRRVEHHRHASCGARATPRAARGSLRRRSSARAGRPADLLGRPDERRLDSARRHLPHLFREPDHQRHRGRPARCPPAHEPPAGAHRRVRGRRLDRPALLRRALPDRAQRRPHRLGRPLGRCEPGRRGNGWSGQRGRGGRRARVGAGERGPVERTRGHGFERAKGRRRIRRLDAAGAQRLLPTPRRRSGRSAHPVHRPGRRAQGPARPAARLRGAARARRRRRSRWSAPRCRRSTI